MCRKQRASRSVGSEEDWRDGSFLAAEREDSETTSRLTNRRATSQPSVCERPFDTLGIDTFICGQRADDLFEGLWVGNLKLG